MRLPLAGSTVNGNDRVVLVYDIGLPSLAVVTGTISWSWSTILGLPLAGKCSQLER